MATTEPALTATRRITKRECPWLPKPIAKGASMYEYWGCTYGCISPSGRAISFERGKGPFFEVPANAVARATHTGAGDSPERT